MGWGQDRAVARQFRTYRSDWRARTGAALLTDDYLVQGDEDITRFWDMGMPAYRKVENLMEWFDVWLGNTMSQLANLETPAANLEQIPIAGTNLMLWNDDRCTGPHFALENTAATTLMINDRDRRGQKGAARTIYGAVLLTCYHWEEGMNAAMPLPLDQGGIATALKVQEFAKLVLGKF
jgi:hypothetical protein